MERLEKTQTLGFYVTQNEMWELSKDSYWKESWSGEMLGELLLAKPEYADHLLRALCSFAICVEIRNKARQILKEI